MRQNYIICYLGTKRFYSTLIGIDIFILNCQRANCISETNKRTNPVRRNVIVFRLVETKLKTKIILMQGKFHSPQTGMQQKTETQILTDWLKIDSPKGPLRECATVHRPDSTAKNRMAYHPVRETNVTTYKE